MLGVMFVQQSIKRRPSWDTFAGHQVESIKYVSSSTLSILALFFFFFFTSMAGWVYSSASTWGQREVNTV